MVIKKKAVKKVVKKASSKKVVKKRPLKKETSIAPKVAKKKTSVKKAVKTIAPKVSKTKKIPGTIEKIKAGIPGFDVLTRGGIERGSVNLVVGDSGSGKTVFSMQFLMNGLKQGEKCLYITFEEGKKEFYSNMKNFNWDLEGHAAKGNFFFLEYSPEKVKSMVETGGGEIETLITQNKITRVVIDSITSFELLFEKELEKREASLALFNIMRRWDCTSLFTLQENPGMREITKSTPLEFEAEGIILMYFIREKDSRKRMIEVLKMRGTDHSKRAHYFTIGKNKGIVVSNKVYHGTFK